MAETPDLTLFDVVVIGAGMSGLAARAELVRQGLSVATLEKSRGLGGRCATRRGSDWIADLGAQFTTVRTPEFREFCAPMQQDLREIFLATDRTFPRYAHRSGMSAFAHALKNSVSQSVPIHFNKRVTALAADDAYWTLRCETGETFRARGIVFALPAPQAVLLLGSLPQSDQGRTKPLVSALARAKYFQCVTVAVELKVSTAAEEFPAVYQNPTPRLLGIYDQLRKGLDSARSVVVIHADPGFSQDLWGLDDGAVHAAILQEAIQAVDGLRDSEPLLVHRWGYSQLSGSSDDATISEVIIANESDTSLPLAIAGDGMARSTVESAFESGIAAAHRISHRLKGGREPSVSR